MATPIHEGWTELFSNCTVSIEADEGAENQEQSHGKVVHDDIPIYGTVFLVDSLSNRRLDAYRLTWSPDQDGEYSLRYEAPAGAAVTRVSLAISIDVGSDVDDFFTAVQTMELAFLSVYGPPS
jgi:hypothetical protein